MSITPESYRQAFPAWPLCTVRLARMVQHVRRPDPIVSDGVKLRGTLLDQIVGAGQPTVKEAEGYGAKGNAASVS
jgi:hypothetical protein